MSNIALIKKSYNQPNYITAKEAIKGDNNKIYYCPNNKCKLNYIFVAEMELNILIFQLIINIKNI